jgi:hypothetical protein
MKLRKCDYYVFSVYSSVSQGYPYYPFIAKTINQGIKKYIGFLENRDYICEGAELHLIGTCEVHDDCIIPETIQPLFAPQRVDIKNNLLGRLVILSTHYSIICHKYINKIYKLFRGEKDE